MTECPRCGAPVEASRSRCSYCDAEYTTATEAEAQTDERVAWWPLLGCFVTLLGAALFLTFLKAKLFPHG